MPSPQKDTIAAVSTAIGPGAIGIVRLSGSKSISIAKTIFQAMDTTLFDKIPSHTLKLGKILDKDILLDEVLLVIMRSPRSYTRQDMVEIQCHGGNAALRSVLRLVLRHGARLALPGEFTRLAFETGRIDLNQAQAVLEIIEARTDAALRSAAARLSGRLGEHVGTLKELIVQTLVELEAALNFPDEELGDLENLLVLNIRKSQRITKQLLDGAKAARLYKNGLSVVIAGKPNVGKSSLFNRLLRTSRAIVTPEPGTTRDLIDETLSIEGVPVRLTDSAGLRRAQGEAERFGIQLAQQAVEQANLVLAVLDSSVPLEPEDRDMLERLHLRKIPTLYVLNKMDLPKKLYIDKIPYNSVDSVSTSAITGKGIHELTKAIGQRLLKKNIAAPEDALIASARESDCIKRADVCLQRADIAIRSGLDLEAVSLDLRDALSMLGQLLGEVDDEQILEQIFSQFCIGK